MLQETLTTVAFAVLLPVLANEVTIDRRLWVALASPRCTTLVQQLNSAPGVQTVRASEARCMVPDDNNLITSFAGAFNCGVDSALRSDGSD